LRRDRCCTIACKTLHSATRNRRYHSRADPPHAVIGAVAYQQRSRRIDRNRNRRAERGRQRRPRIASESCDAATGKRRYLARNDRPYALIPCIRDVQRPIRAHRNALRRVQLRARRGAAITREALHAVARNHAQHAGERRLIHLVPVRVGEVEIPGSVERNAIGQQRQ
jgi:hypothetical protein